MRLWIVILRTMASLVITIAAIIFWKARHFSGGNLSGWWSGLDNRPDPTVNVSSDGKWRATVCDENYICVADAGTGVERNRFVCGQKFCWSIAFTPDCRTIAAYCGGGSITFWDPITGLKQDEFPQISAWGNCLMIFSPDGKKLALSVGGNSHPYVWDLSTGEEIKCDDDPMPFYLSGNEIVYLSFNAIGDTLKAGNVEALGLWNLTTGECLAYLELWWFKRFFPVLGIFVATLICWACQPRLRRLLKRHRQADQVQCMEASRCCGRVR